MKLKSKYFDTIRAARTPSQNVQTQQGCDWPDCTRPGTHPAPIAHDTDAKRHFCLEHVRIYNKSYNFFEGMEQSDITAYQRSAHTGHRPTWNIGSRHMQQGKRAEWQFQDPLELMKHIGAGRSGHKKSSVAPANRRVTTGQSKALAVLGLDETVKTDQVKARYKILVKRYHPDTNGGDRSLEEELNKTIRAFNFLKASGFC